MQLHNEHDKKKKNVQLSSQYFLSKHFFCAFFSPCAKCRAPVTLNVRSASRQRTTTLRAISSTPMLRTLAPIMALFTRFCKWPKGFNVVLYRTASHHFKKQLAKVKLGAIDSRYTVYKNSISNVQHLICMAVFVRRSKSPAMQVVITDLNT